jgi:monothiol glutaredoxin
MVYKFWIHTINSKDVGKMTNASIQALIDGQLKENDVVLYMKGDRDFPQCGFSAVVVQILKNLGIEFKTYNVLEDPELRQGIKDYTDWPTIPQLYIKGEFIGGCDIVREMFTSGELQTLIREKLQSRSL